MDGPHGDVLELPKAKSVGEGQEGSQCHWQPASDTCSVFTKLDFTRIHTAESEIAASSLPLFLLETNRHLSLIDSCQPRHPKLFLPKT